MEDQDAKDINQMMSGTVEPTVKTPRKSKFVWVVLGCVVLGVGLGVVVYQQSIKSTVPKTTPKPTAIAQKPASPIPSPYPSPTLSPSPVATSSVAPNKPTVNSVGGEDYYGDYEIDNTDGDYLALTPGTSPTPKGTPVSVVSPSPSATPTSTISASAIVRTTMPDTSEGVPETGVFEITIGTVSVGLALLVLGLFGLLAI